MKTTLRLLTAAAAVIGFTGVSVAQEVTLRFQHFVSNRASIPAHFILPWAEKVEQDSDGRIKVEIYPQMQLGGAPPALYDQIRDGVVDGAWALPGYTPGRFVGAEVFELPFITSKSAEASSKAFWEFYEKYLTEEFKDIKVLAVHVHGPGIIHTRDEPVSSVDDIDGMKLRMPTRIAGQLLESMGATPIGMPVPAFPEALSKGVVDGGVIPWEIVVPLKVQELADYHAEVGGNRSLYNTTFIWGMNQASYDALPDDLKAVIDANSGLEASGWAGRAMDTGDAPARDVTVNNGNTILEISEEETARFKELGDQVVAAWIEEMSERGLPAAQMVEDARAMVEKYSQ